MTDLIDNNNKAGNLIDKLFSLLDMRGTSKFKNAWGDYTNNVKEIIKKEEINENDIRNIIEYFDFVMKNPYYAETLTLKSRNILSEEQKKKKENKLKSYRSAIKIKKKILNYFIEKKILEKNAIIICHVNNINRWLLETPAVAPVAPVVAPAVAPVAPVAIQPILNFKKVKDYEKQNKEWRNEIIKIINMEKREREDYKKLTGNLKNVKDLLTLDGDWRSDDPHNPKQTDLLDEDKKSMNYLNLLLEGEKVQIDPIKKGNSSVPGKSNFKENKCVEIAQYDDKFCVTFTGNKCHAEDYGGTKGGRKRKSKRRRKKSRKYLRRKRRESRRKELKRKSKKKMV